MSSDYVEGHLYRGLEEKYAALRAEVAALKEDKNELTFALEQHQEDLAALKEERDAAEAERNRLRDRGRTLDRDLIDRLETERDAAGAREAALTEAGTKVTKALELAEEFIINKLGVYQGNADMIVLCRTARSEWKREAQ